MNLQSTRKAVEDWGSSVTIPVGELEDGAGESREGGEPESRVCAEGRDREASSTRVKDENQHLRLDVL